MIRGFIYVCDSISLHTVHVCPASLPSNRMNDEAVQRIPLGARVDAILANIKMSHPELGGRRVMEGFHARRPPLGGEFVAGVQKKTHTTSVVAPRESR